MQLLRYECRVWVGWTLLAAVAEGKGNVDMSNEKKKKKKISHIH